MTRILAIDPGPERSALVVLEDGRPTLTMIDTNAAIRYTLLTGPLYQDWNHRETTVVIEQVEAMGMPVGREVFETVFYSGRFAECWGGPWVRIPRSAVKLHHCHSRRANDAAIRQALLDRFGPGKDKAIGVKRAPGPLYNIKSHLWPALAVGLVHYDTQEPARIAG